MLTRVSWRARPGNARSKRRLERHLAEGIEIFDDLVEKVGEHPSAFGDYRMARSITDRAAFLQWVKRFELAEAGYERAVV